MGSACSAESKSKSVKKANNKHIIYSSSAEHSVAEFIEKKPIDSEEQETMVLQKYHLLRHTNVDKTSGNVVGQPGPLLYSNGHANLNPRREGKQSTLSPEALRFRANTNLNESEGVSRLPQLIAVAGSPRKAPDRRDSDAFACDTNSDIMSPSTRTQCFHGSDESGGSQNVMNSPQLRSSNNTHVIESVILGRQPSDPSSKERPT